MGFSANSASHALKVAPLLVLSTLALGACRSTPPPPTGSQLSQPATPPAATTPSSLASPSSAQVASSGAAPDVAALVAKVKLSVVNITVEHEAKMPAFDSESPFDFFFRGGPGDVPQGPGAMRKQRALGSGFLVDGQGHVVTNAHVVDGADTVRVKLVDEREFKAKVRGRDTRLDLAVLEIEGAKDLPFVPLGSSDAVQVGEYVVAIGNPFGLGNTVTMGIVSAKGRTIGAGPYDDFIQTDASINPGNSGGPLFDARGQVVGINTAINPAGHGIGFAIPSDALRAVLPQLIKEGHVSRGRIGIRIQPIDEPLAKAMGLASPRGALAADVEKGGPADSAGVKNGDIIVAVDSAEVRRAQDLPRLIASHSPGTKVNIKLLRGGSEKVVAVTLDAIKDDEAQNAKASRSSSLSPHGELGLSVQDAEGGVVVRRVAPGSAADGSLFPGDVIVEVNRESVRNTSDLASKVKASPEGKPVLLQVRREGAMLYVAIDRSK
ncbi:MAG: Do family serine endopeptidase [Polyangiaceae bacterium]|nr:Do family serine endopeptidase [Polyangiaceae bacterium]